MGRIKTHSANFGFNLTPIVFQQNPIVHIQSAFRQYKFGSLTWSFNFQNIATGIRLNLGTQQMIDYDMQIGNLLVVASPFAYEMLPQVAPNPSLVDRRIHICEPGQYCFEEIFCEENLYIWQQFLSVDIIDSYAVEVNLTIQLKEI